MEQPASKRLPLKQAYPFAEQHGLGADVERIRTMEIEWDRGYDSSVRRGYFVELFRRHGLLDAFRAEYWPLGATPSGGRECERVLRLKDQYEAFLADGSDGDDLELPGDAEAADQEFAAEADLRDFLAKNLGLIEAGLQVVERDGRSGIEFPVADGRIDILAVDRQQHFVVIELKLSRGRNKTLGQVLYYMAWVDAHLGNGPCRGLIIAKEISPDLTLAVQRATGVSLFNYRLSMSIAPVA
ncbi:MAG: endonuclease NucS [Acidobacteria bacterium]|nr:endonuclease NucS [Acidobacteriota bacterium]